jgi:hypothetical protein
MITAFREGFQERKPGLLNYMLKVPVSEKIVITIDNSLFSLPGHCGLFSFEPETGLTAIPNCNESLPARLHDPL